MLNVEKYKEELKEIYLFDYDNPRRAFERIKEHLDGQIKMERRDHPTDAILNWMTQPYKEPILDNVEREYLSAVIRPFRKDVVTISKFKTWDNSSQYIHIETKGNYSSSLPVFPKGTMYKGMEDGRYYSLKELGL